MMTQTDLPEILPVFPLTGALLLPRARLPLHIFEPRYLALLEDVHENPQPVDRHDPAARDPGGRVRSFAPLAAPGG